VNVAGRLFGVGLGPGDPELLTVKAVRVIAECPVIAYFAKTGRRGNARTIADRWIPASCEELQLGFPMTTEVPFDHPEYLSALSAFYEQAAAKLAKRLRRGLDVALLAEGDPLFYGSFMHLFERLKFEFETHIVPGVTGMAGCAASASAPMTWGDDVLTVLPGTLPFEVLVQRLKASDSAVVMKLGRNFDKVRSAFAEAGLLGRALYVERGTMPNEKVLPLAEKAEGQAPYFSLILLPGQGRARERR
jgi:precorrin-2/cobalt-factor-2 C20-methyltransferase